jgi:hypothetical protein
MTKYQVVLDCKMLLEILILISSSTTFSSTTSPLTGPMSVMNTQSHIYVVLKNAVLHII